ncbi:hypothetical protein R6Q59_023544 [Mikania micrantha]
MPMGWRLLHTLDQLNHHFGLEIGIPEISLMYQLRTHGSSHFVLQRRSGAPILVPGITFNEDEWRNRFFFVKRNSIPHGEILPFKWVEKAPKFESLVAEEEESRNKIRSLLKIDEQHKKFGANFEAITPMALESTFNLEDLDTFFVVTKEKASPAAPKSRAMTTRSSKTTKKRKGVDTVDLEEPSDMSIYDLLKKVSAKYASEKEQIEKQIEDLEDQKKIFTAKAGHYEKELAKAKKQMKEMEATHKLQFKEHIDGAMKSAAIAVLRAKIQLVNQAKAEGVDSLAKNMKELGRILATLAGDKAEASVEVNKAGEVGETSKAGDVEVTGVEAGALEQEVTMGDDDNDAKV